jgi:hypothetical protein
VMLCLSHRAMCTVLPSLKCNSEESPFHGDSSEGDCAFFVFPGLPCDNSCDYSKNSVHMLFNLFQFADPAQRFRHEFDAITTSAVTTFFLAILQTSVRLSSTPEKTVDGELHVLYSSAMLWTYWQIMRILSTASPISLRRMDDVFDMFNCSDNDINEAHNCCNSTQRILHGHKWYLCVMFL